MKPVQVSSFKIASPVVKSLPAVQGMYIASGRQSAVLQIAEMPLNYANKNAHQVFAKAPGALVYDMDGSGNQINVSLRGLDPHRSWELNVRQDGIMTNSDIYGYPASHYSVPLEAVERVEVISGAAALGYGAQFGGMMNYVTKSPDTTRKAAIQNITTAGSYGLLSNFTSIGGKAGKLTYYGYYHRRKSEGYREQAQSNSEAYFLRASLELSRKARVETSLGYSYYLYRIPGPLNDSMFMANPRQATRSRNWYSPNIYIPAVRLFWDISPNTSLMLSSSALFGARNSVMFIGFANVPDVVDPATNNFRHRQVDIDNFKSFTNELRLRHRYGLGAALSGTFIGGVQYLNNDLRRRQLGKGTTGNDYDLTNLEPYGRDMHFRSKNIAVFAENLFEFSPRLSATLGLRYENGNSVRSGFVRYLNPEVMPLEIKRNFVLLGASAQYAVSTGQRIFAGISQAYRPTIFADLVPPNALERTDPNVKDAFGYNAELGWENYADKRLRYSLTLFRMAYNNRIGSIYVADGAPGAPFLLKTNTGNTVTLGAELYAEYTGEIGKRGAWSLFTATSRMEAEYVKGTLTRGTENVDIKGNKLEGVPAWISRNGARVYYKNFGATLQYTYVSGHHSDAFNTKEPTANGARGWVPAYDLWDLNLSYRPSARVRIIGGIQNILNEQYFTKRPVIYPGPGVWPSDGRNWFVTLETNF